MLYRNTREYPQIKIGLFKSFQNFYLKITKDKLKNNKRSGEYRCITINIPGLIENL